MTISKHFQEDRADRYAFIATEIGLGTVVHTYKQPKSNYRKSDSLTVNITSTGIAVIKSDDNKLVTMYVLTLSEAEKYFENKEIPFLLAAVIRSNMKRKYHIKQNKVHY